MPQFKPLIKYLGRNDIYIKIVCFYKKKQLQQNNSFKLPKKISL